MNNVTRQSSDHAPVLLLVLAYLAFISLGLPDALLGVAWPSISQQFGVLLGFLGLLLAAASAGYLTTRGWVAARLGIGRLLAASCLRQQPA